MSEPEKIGSMDSRQELTSRIISPSKTPMYEASHAERYIRQSLIKQIQTEVGNRLLCYVAGAHAPITRDDTIGVVELLHNVTTNSDIDFLLHTRGGDIDAAEKLVSIIRSKVGSGQLRIIVPDHAKSAGTLIALAADWIVMSDSSELGPIDPQITLDDGRGNAIPQSVMSYLDAYRIHADALREDPNNLAARVMLNKLDPTLLNLFEAAKNRAQLLAEEHLHKWMFQRKTANYTKIASDLMDNKRWLSHGQVIGYQTAIELELEVKYLESDSPEWQQYWRLYCYQRLAVKDNQKLFESDYASLPIEGSA